MSNDFSRFTNRKGIDWRRMRDNHGALAAFLVRLMDRSPNRLAILEIPPAAVLNDQVDEVEEVVRREYGRAKLDRPDLGLSLAPATADYPDTALLVAVHEHHWIGGRCVHGCSKQRDAS
jgi:hypothetical protein